MGGADFESVNGTPPWARDVMALCERAAQLFGTGASLSNNCRVIAWWATDVQAALDSLAAQLDNDPHAADHVGKEAVERAEDNLQELVALAKQHMHHGTLPLFALLRRTKELVDGAAADLRAALVGTLPADDLQMLTAPRLRVDNSVAPVLQSIGRSPNSGRPRTYSMQRSP
ncbi:hypothetical protein JKP88DRAFT_230668 [Tribonema minus]|uniref:Uncharacterized protein n=1 Tax=Tribonema minus TaxID=303371 RepID=A0A835ZFM6_9STRA|nr:hypothetical protein JKP88DRAFT_230668 [Tribonema minus]|eukprot:TRINITY_DN2764_c1_g1_i3.p2 TRINITY_DN2764_c1_g1~~TRINITY_DN2764_c1_g1_i3.p2  ORF type:complete len:172 (-),score=70.44 TRINITY_DN2764_c1_g1_i3:175-690(-)